MTEAELREKIQFYTRSFHRTKLNICRDTTQFMDISAEDVLELEGHYYFILGEAVEGRFGLDDEPKFWVKKAIDLDDGSKKILKLVFYESFTMSLGDFTIECFRSPRKESRVLKKIGNDPNFMHGYTLKDAAGNPVRVIEKILGSPYYNVINKLDVDHETYFYEHFPAIFENIIECIRAIGRLHLMGEIHGDIRNDHIFIDRESGKYRWIDFDYTYEWSENPFGVDILGLGNILLFTVGNGFHYLRDISACAPEGMKLRVCVETRDLSLFFRHRIINLKKLFPYIPESLNHILMHFCVGTEVFYENIQELLNDITLCRTDLKL